MSSWSEKFKERMLQLSLCIRDFETKEIHLAGFGEIHDTLICRMNEKRRDKGLHALDYDETFKRGRGYVRKDNGKFMLVKEAVEWASATGYDNDVWSGESISLRQKQVNMGGERMY